MSGCAARRNHGQRRWAAAVVALGLAMASPACFFGGLTGDSDASSMRGGGCPERELAFEEKSGQGMSAADLMAELGGLHEGRLGASSADFWQWAGLEPETEPVVLQVTLDYAGGRILERSCGVELSVGVSVTVSLGLGLAQWRQDAKLVRRADETELFLVLPASESAAAHDFVLEVTFGSEGATATLTAASDESQASASFDLD